MREFPTNHVVNNSQVNIDNYFENYAMPPQTTKHSKVNMLFSPKQRGEEDESILSRSDHFGRKFNESFNKTTKSQGRYQDKTRDERQCSKKDVLTKFKSNVKALQNYGTNSGNMSLLDTTLGPEAF